MGAFCPVEGTLANGFQGGIFSSTRLLWITSNVGGWWGATSCECKKVTTLECWLLVLVETIEIDVHALKERALGHIGRVKKSGDACNHTHKWQVLGLNMGLNGNF